MPEALAVYKIPDFGAEVRLYPDLELLSRAAADIFTDRAARALAAQGRFSVALSGGRTPEGTFELLAQSPRPCTRPKTHDRLGRSKLAAGNVALAKA